MTDTDVQTETAPEAPEQPALAAPASPVKEALWTRLVLPLALPILSAIAVGLWATNLSRVFLASSKEGALVVVLVVTVTIMVVATTISAAQRMRSSNQSVLVATLIVLILSAGFLTVSRSEEHGVAGPAGYVAPKGDAITKLEVDALPSLAFQAKEFTVPAGIIELDYIDKGGTHTLLFDTSDPNLSQLLLKVPTGKHVEKVELKAGKYVIYCNIPGHRAAGMEATITAG